MAYSYINTISSSGNKKLIQKEKSPIADHEQRTLIH